MDREFQNRKPRLCRLLCLLMAVLLTVQLLPAAAGVQTQAAGTGSLTVTLPGEGWSDAAYALKYYSRITVKSQTAGYNRYHWYDPSGITFTDLPPAEDYTVTVMWDWGQTYTFHDVYTQSGISVAADQTTDLTLDGSGLKLLYITALMENFSGQIPFQDQNEIGNAVGVYVGGYKYYPDAQGCLGYAGLDSAIIVPATWTTQRVNRDTKNASGEYYFEPGVLDITTQTAFTVVAKYRETEEKTITFRMADGTPLADVQLMITQQLPDSTYRETATTDENGQLMCRLAGDTPYTVQPQGKYTLMENSGGMVRPENIWLTTAAVDSADQLTFDGSGWSCMGDLTVTLAAPTETKPMTLHLTDAFGSAAAGVTLALSPTWTADTCIAVTDADGNASFALCAACERYTVLVKAAAVTGSRTVQTQYLSVTETERQSGTVNRTVTCRYTPELTDLQGKEEALLSLSGSAAGEGYYAAACADGNGRWNSGLDLQEGVTASADYRLIPTTGVTGYELKGTNGKTAYTATGASVNYAGWTQSALAQFGALSGSVAVDRSGAISAQGGSTVTLKAACTQTSVEKSRVVYVLTARDGTVLTLTGSSTVTLRLGSGTEFTVSAHTADNMYNSPTRTVTVPARDAAVTLTMEPCYLKLHVVDENGLFYAAEQVSWGIYSGGAPVKSDTQVGEATVTLDTAVTGAVRLYVTYGAVNISNYSEDWVSVELDRSTDFNGGTIQVTVPRTMTASPAVRMFVRDVTGDPIKNVLVQALTKTTSRVTLQYRKNSRDQSKTTTLTLPEGAVNYQETNAQNTYADASFEIATDLLLAGQAKVTLSLEEEVLQQVTLNADAFAVSTQNTLSSAEITYREIKYNNPNLPESGCFRTMPKDAPLLMANSVDYRSSVENLDSSYLSFETTRQSFQVSVSIDGIPVNYADFKITSADGGRIISTSVSSMTTPGYEEQTGRIWQQSYYLEQWGAFDGDTGMGWLMLPFYEPESYPHTYEVSAMLRYADDTQPDGWYYESRTEYVTVYANTAYLKCYSFIHYDSPGSGICEEASSTYWVRPKTSQELKAYQNNTAFRLDWNNTNLFTFRATFVKPEEVSEAWVVADVAEDCENRYFRLYYDEDQKIWTGTGKLGSVLSIPDGFCIQYTLKRSEIESDYPVFDVADLEANMFNGADSLPEGWSCELIAPRDMTLEACLAKWEAYGNGVAGLSGDRLGSFLTEFFGQTGRVSLPGLKITTDTGEEAIVYNYYEIDPQTPAEGRRVGVRTEEGTAELQIVTTMEGDSAGRTIYGDAGLLLPASTVAMLDTAGLSYAKAILRGAKWGCEIISGALDIYTKAGVIVDTDAALTDKADEWTKDLPADAMEDYQAWQDTKAINDVMDLCVGLLGATVPFTLPITTVFDLWLFKKTNDVDALYRKMAEINRKNKLNEERLRRLHPDDFDPDMNKHIDPSGYVYEAVPSNRLEGVTATVKTLVKGEWVDWDSEAYDEGPNPQITGADGGYGWNVSEGKWKVVFEKQGYEMAESIVLDVPPAHTDVNICMSYLYEPYLKSTAAAVGGKTVEFTFSHYMCTSGVLGNVYLTCNGRSVSATLEAVDGELTAAGNKQKNCLVASGVSVAGTYRFTLEEPVKAGDKYKLMFPNACLCYNGQSYVDWEGTGKTVTVYDGTQLQEPTTLSFKSDGYAVSADGLELAGELVSDGDVSGAIWTSLSPDSFAVDSSGHVTTRKGGTGYICVKCNDLMAICAVADHVQAGVLTLYAVDALTGEKIAPPQTIYVLQGDRYSVDAPAVSGFTAQTATVYGTMIDTAQSVTVKYNAATPVAVTVQPDGTILLALRTNLTAGTLLAVAGYDQSGRMLWCKAQTPANTAVGQTLTVTPPESSCKTLRLYVVSKDGIPLTEAIEITV